MKNMTDILKRFKEKYYNPKLKYKNNVNLYINHNLFNYPKLLWI